MQHLNRDSINNKLELIASSLKEVNIYPDNAAAIMANLVVLHDQVRNMAAESQAGEIIQDFYYRSKSIVEIANRLELTTDNVERVIRNYSKKEFTQR